MNPKQNFFSLEIYFFLFFHPPPKKKIKKNKQRPFFFYFYRIYKEGTNLRCLKTFELRSSSSNIFLFFYLPVFTQLVSDPWNLIYYTLFLTRASYVSIEHLERGQRSKSKIHFVMDVVFGYGFFYHRSCDERNVFVHNNIFFYYIIYSNSFFFPFFFLSSIVILCIPF